MPRKNTPIRELFVNTQHTRSEGARSSVWACIRCGWELVDNATRFAKHITRCPKATDADRCLAKEHLAGLTPAQLEALDYNAEFTKAFSLGGKAHVRTLFEDTNTTREGEKARLFRCRRCGHETTENATRFAQHILKCDKANEEDRSIAQEHEALTEKRRQMRKAKQAGADASLASMELRLGTPETAETSDRSGSVSHGSDTKFSISGGQGLSGEDVFSRARWPSKGSAMEDPRGLNISLSQNLVDIIEEISGAADTLCDHGALDELTTDLDAPPDLHHGGNGGCSHGCVGSGPALSPFSVSAPVQAGSQASVAITTLPMASQAESSLLLGRLGFDILGDLQLSSQAPDMLPVTGPCPQAGPGHSSAESPRMSEASTMPAMAPFTGAFLPLSENSFIGGGQKRQRYDDVMVPTESPMASPEEWREFLEWKRKRQQQQQGCMVPRTHGNSSAMWQSLYGYFLNSAQNCARVYGTYNRTFGPQGSFQLVTDQIYNDWAKLANVFKTMVSCCGREHLLMVYEKVRREPDRILGLYNAGLSLARDCVADGPLQAMTKRAGRISEMDTGELAVFSSLERAFSHLTIDENGQQCDMNPLVGPQMRSSARARWCVLHA
mmetsp:Transcript_23651/g.65600  ORF Transcript_23651/g.65600 Transcript_23651/m.65600 type:complete len:611 (+) Transcript_23651:236-2068(+)